VDGEERRILQCWLREEMVEVGAVYSLDLFSETGDCRDELREQASEGGEEGLLRRSVLGPKKGETLSPKWLWMCGGRESLAAAFALSLAGLRFLSQRRPPGWV